MLLPLNIASVVVFQIVEIDLLYRFLILGLEEGRKIDAHTLDCIHVVGRGMIHQIDVPWVLLLQQLYSFC